jgi:hypothetical protein
MIMQLYHGSNVVVAKPEIQITGYYKDFGFGFYCTNLERQARRWALSKKKGHVVSVYEYVADDTLLVQSFPEMTESWLDFIVSCRRGVKHDFDIVEGPMADDQIWDYVEDLVAGNISREAFWALVKFKRPTHQIVFCTDQALQTLKYEKSYSL